MAAPSYVAAGTAQAVTTSAAMPYPAGLAAGDLIILTVSNTASGIGAASGTWTELGTVVTGGSMSSRRWWKIATGSETGSETINVTSGGSGIGYMTAYRPATSGNALTPTMTSGADAVSDTSYSTSGSSWTTALDNRVVVEVITIAATTFGAVASARSLTQSGATYSQTDRFAARAVSNTLYYAHSDAAVTSGGTGAPSFTATLNGAGTGQTVFIKIVESVPVGGSVTAVAATATAAANAPVWRGGGKVTAVRAQATAASNAPTIDPHTTPSYTGQGSVVAVTSATAAPPYPATLAANDGLLMFVSTNGSAMGAAPSGWTQVGTTQVAGGIQKACFFKRASGTETGTVSVTGLTGGTKGDAYIVRFTPANSSDAINVSANGWQDTDATTTTLTGTGTSWTSSPAGIIASSYTANAPTTSYSSAATSPTITQSGATITTTARFAARTGVAGDNTIAYGFQTGAVSVGGTGAPTFTATTAGDNGQGAGFLVLVTETAATNAVVNAVVAPSTAASSAPLARQSVRPVATTATAALQPPAILGDSGAPAFRDSGNAQGSSAITSLTVTTPATVQVGDMGIVIVMAGAGSGAPTAPSGWSTDLANSFTNGGSAGVSVFHRVFQAGDASPQVVWGSAPVSGNNTAMLAVWYSGAINISVNTPTVSATASTSWATGTVNTAGPDNTILTVGAMKAGGSGWASTASWSPDAQMRATRYATGNFFPSIVVGDFIQTTPGTTNAQTVTWNLSSANAMAFQIDLAGSGVNASVAAVTATATGAARAPGTGSTQNVFPPRGTGSALVQVPVIFAATAQTGGGPMAATALFVAPGARQRIFVNARATATAAALPPPPPGSSNIAVKAVATALAVAPLLFGGARVSPPAASASAAMRTLGVNGAVPSPRFLATALVLPPQVGLGTVRPGPLKASALVVVPVVHGSVLVPHATATALLIAPTVRSVGAIFVARAQASAIAIVPISGRKEWVFRTPVHNLHYRTGDPLMDRIGYPTGTSVLLIDGFYINVDYPDDEQLQVATKAYLGGRDYILSPEEVVSLTSAGYGEFIKQEVFI